MKTFLFLLLPLSVSCYAASPSWESFNTDVLRTNGFRVGINTNGVQLAILTPQVTNEWSKVTNGLLTALQITNAAVQAATAATNGYPWGSLYDAAGRALAATNGYPWGSLYDAAGAATAVTNGYPWGTLYDASGAALNATNKLTWLITTNDLRAVKLTNAVNQFGGDASLLTAVPAAQITGTYPSGTTNVVIGTIIAGTGVTLATNGNQLTAALKSTGTAGTYTKTTFDAQGRETSGTTLSAGDIPDLSATYEAHVSDLTNRIPAANLTGTYPAAATNVVIGTIIPGSNITLTTNGNQLTVASSATASTLIRELISGGAPSFTIASGNHWMPVNGIADNIYASAVICSQLAPTSGYLSNLLVWNQTQMAATTNIQFIVETNVAPSTMVSSLLKATLNGATGINFTNSGTTSVQCTATAGAVWAMKVIHSASLPSQGYSWTIEWWHQ